jgi:hypothetical protein
MNNIIQNAESSDAGSMSEVEYRDKLEQYAEGCKHGKKDCEYYGNNEICDNCLYGATRWNYMVVTKYKQGGR